VALASCHFVSGWRINLPAIGKFLRQRTLSCVDGIQTVGAFPTSVEHIDFLPPTRTSGPGPCAAGFFCAGRRRSGCGPPCWLEQRALSNVAQEGVALRSGASL
jgi:hypothetical protein